MIKRFLLWLWREIPFPFSVRYFFLWLLNQKFLIGVDALIVNDKQEVLLFKHSYRKEIPWGLPAGWLKRGEEHAQAIEREIFEEAGFHARMIKPLTMEKSERIARLDIVFLGELRDETDFVPSDEVIEAGFFPGDKLPNIISSQAAIIKAYLFHQDD